jgi:hypothetical protein
MLFPDVTHWNLLAVTVGNGDTEDALAQEDPLGMVPKRAMPEIREESFGLVIQPIAKKLGITKRIGWHTFRRTYSSILQGNGEDVKVVQELLRLDQSDARCLRTSADTEQACGTAQSG